MLISHDRDEVDANGLWLMWDEGTAPEPNDRIYLIDDKGNGAFIRVGEVDGLIESLRKVVPAIPER